MEVASRAVSYTSSKNHSTIPNVILPLYRICSIFLETVYHWYLALRAVIYYHYIPSWRYRYSLALLISNLIFAICFTLLWHNFGNGVSEQIIEEVEKYRVIRHEK